MCWRYRIIELHHRRTLTFLTCANLACSPGTGSSGAAFQPVTTNT
jgi:hypothetical protein